MARGASFKQADAARALRAAVAAGLRPSSCIIRPDGSIEVAFTEAPGGSRNPLDRVLENEA